MSVNTEKPLDTVLKEVRAILDVFLSNRYKESLEMIEQEGETHFYFSTLKAYFLAVNGLVTFEQDELEKGLKACHESLKKVNQKRKNRFSLMKLLWTPNYNDYTEDEVHAEAGYAALTSIVAVLSLAVEKSFVGLIKAGYYIKSSFDTVKELKQITRRRTNWESELSKETFDVGVFQGLGIFNLIISLLPSRILKLLQFLGFPGNRKYGLRLLEKAALSGGLWSPLSALIILVYNTQIEFIMGLGECDQVAVKNLLDIYLHRYKKSGFFLLFDASLRQIQGKPEEAIPIYEETVTLFKNWKQWNNACYWQMIWCYAVQFDWENAAKYTKLLKETCSWSPCIFTYQYASFLHMINEDNGFKDPEIQKQVSELLTLAPQLKHSIAGKTIFMEKFVTKRCQIYFEDNETLVLPVLEQFVFWNIFSTCKQSPRFLTGIINRIDDKLKLYSNQGSQSDKYYYLMFMRGVCYRYLGFPLDACAAFEEVSQNEDKLTLYSHLPPLAALELGLIYKEMGELKDAKKWLEKARSDYNHYLNETMVHIRAHSALNNIKDIECGRKRSPSIMSLISTISSKLSYPK